MNAHNARAPQKERNGTGASFDSLLNVLYVNVNDAPTINRLRAVHDQPGDAAPTPVGLGRQIY